MKILVKFPTRGRPNKFLDTYEKYVNLAQNKNDLFVMVTLDTDDETVTSEFIENIKSKFSNVQIDIGISGTKIKAVNRDMEKAPYYDILLLASDDMVPMVDGYDEIIRKNMINYYPDTDGVLWFNDGIQGKNLNTLCIIGRKYYNRFGYIYYPEYKSFYCDDEFTYIANQLRRQKYFDQIIIEHKHFVQNQELWDNTYDKNSKYADEDKKLFHERKLKYYTTIFDIQTNTSMPKIILEIPKPIKFNEEYKIKNTNISYNVFNKFKIRIKHIT
jgi:hypothetical protein